MITADQPVPRNRSVRMEYAFATLLERGRDIDIGVELVDERLAELVADRVVGDQCTRRLAEARAVERLTLDEVRQHADHDQDDREHRQGAGETLRVDLEPADLVLARARQHLQTFGAGEEGTNGYDRERAISDILQGVPTDAPRLDRQVVEQLRRRGSSA
jgi:hypothetical protein